MSHIMLLNFRLILFFVCPIVENIKKILIRRLAIGNIVVDCTIIISNTWNKMADYIKFKVVEGWLT